MPDKPDGERLASYVSWNAGGGTITWPDGTTEPVRPGDAVEVVFENGTWAGLRVTRRPEADTPLVVERR